MRASCHERYLPPSNAAPLVAPHELGLAEQLGLGLSPRPAPSGPRCATWWYGPIDAAQMLAHVPVATALGLGGFPVRLDALSILSMNGNVIEAPSEPAARMRDTGSHFDYADAAIARHPLIATAGEKLRIGVPVPFSINAERPYYWFDSLGMAVPQSRYVRTVPHF